MVLARYLIAGFTLLGAAYLIFTFLFRHDYQRQGRLSSLSILLGTLVYFALGGFPYIYGIRDWPQVYVPSLVEWVGWFCLFGGLALLFTAMFQLGINRSIGQGGGSLKQTGFYRLSRNPQVLGCWLYVIGFTLLWPSWYTLGWAFLFGVITHLMIISEEDHMRRTYGDTYEGYCRKVPRYLSVHWAKNG